MTRARSGPPEPPAELALPPAPPAPQLRLEVIRQSHRRSAALGLSRGERLAVVPMMRSDLTVARDRNQRLCMHAAPVMQGLFEQIAGTESMIVLTDAHGTILHSVGDDDFLVRATKVALAPGENWAEHAKGTNAIGTALFEEKPTLVHASEHYIHANRFLTCSAAPIFDPRGRVLGVLDVTGDHRGYHQHTMGLVRMTARMIENHWLSDDHNQQLRLHFHSRPEFIGTLLEGIVAVAPDGQIVGGNRSAIDQLGLSVSALRAQSLASLLGTSTAALHDHFSAPLAAPLRLWLPTGQSLFVTARLDGPSPPLAAPTPGNAAAASPVAPDTEMLASSAPATNPAAPGRNPAASASPGLHSLCTGDPQIERLVHRLRRVIDRDIPLLIVGETGTDKEGLARAVHQDSARAREPFVAVNCAALPEAWIEAELFGHEGGGQGGAHSGARRARAPGRIVQAHGGTLFLDEIDALPLALQARLLHTLQARSVTPTGGGKAVAVDVAVIAATTRKLRDLINRQAFREDLYGCLHGLALRLPPLRERNDLAVLARRIVQAHRPQDPPDISPAVMDLLSRYSWPGNTRQLAQVLRTATVMSAGERSITTEHLSDDFLEEAQCAAPACAAGTYPAPAGLAERAEPATAGTLRASETELIRRTLQALDGNVAAASRQLGISRNTIYRRLHWKLER